MKKFMMLILSGVFVITLSGCGGGGGSSSDTKIYSVDILDLDAGYILTGLNDNSDVVELEFCGNEYYEYIDYSYYDNGTYEVDDRYVDFDYTGDGLYDYYIDTMPTEYNFVVGDIYDIYDAQDDINPIDLLEITSIDLIDCI